MKDKGPLDDQTTIDMELVSEQSVGHWLKLLKQWDGTSKLSKLDKVLRLETFFTVCFDPFRLDRFPGLSEQVIECEDGGDDSPGCGAEFYGGLRECPFCTNSQSDEPDVKPDRESAEYLVRVHDTKVSAKKAPPATGMQVAGVPAAPQIRDAPDAAQVVKEIEVVEAQTNLAPVATVEELDAAVQRVASTYAAAATNAYECAVELKELHERQLWRQRRDPAGKPVYEHFNSFVEAELAPRGISRPRAYGLIEMAKKFSRDLFDKLGPAKMTVLVSMEQGTREPLAREAAATNMPLRELREKKQQVIGSGGDRRSSGAGKPAVSLVPAHPSERAFTMVFPSSTFSVAFTAATASGKKTKPARDLSDSPVGEVAGINGMRLRITLHQARSGVITATGILIRED